MDGVIKQIDSKRIQLFSPDGQPMELKDVSVRGTRLDFVLPSLDVYDVVTMN